MKKLINKIVAFLMFLVGMLLKLIQVLNSFNKTAINEDATHSTPGVKESHFAPQLPLPNIEDLIKVGDSTFLPNSMWVKVKNPKGRKTGNGFNNFNDPVNLHKGGKITVVAISTQYVLLSYESPNGQGYGSEAGNGTLFLLEIIKFLMFPKTLLLNEAREAYDKEEIMNLLNPPARTVPEHNPM